MNEHYPTNLEGIRAMAEALGRFNDSLASFTEAMRKLAEATRARDKPDDEEGAVKSPR